MDAPLLTDDFNAFLKLLSEHHVEYLVVGGYAVGLHGYPRATVDLDVWVRSSIENGQRIVDAATSDSRGATRASHLPLSADDRPTRHAAISN